MIEVTKKPVSPELVVNKVETDSSGCVVTYIGLVREHSQGDRFFLWNITTLREQPR